jgi:hypothetical protein
VASWSLPQSEDALEAAMEVLFENPFTPDVLDYQLFHESLRDYLKKRYPAEARRWNGRLAEWCGGWVTLAGESRVYALKHGVQHLEQARLEGTTAALTAMRKRVESGEFRQAQYAGAGLRAVLDDLMRVARAAFQAEGSWQAAFGLLMLHAQEGRQIHAREMASLRQTACSGESERLHLVLAKERDPLARFLATLLAAWELADAGKPFLEVLLEAEKVPGVALEAHGLARADAERLLAAASAE